MAILPYVDFSWPELRDVDRGTPLLLPLGGGLDLQAALDAWKQKDALALPAFAYGWPGSALEVPAETLRNVLRHLVECLHEDGWMQVALVAATAAGLEGLGAEVFAVTRPVPEAQPPDPSGKVALLPCGHVEQHGLHLPYDTDTRIIEAIARGTHALRPETTVLLPALEYGVSSHRRSFFGTLSAGGRAYEQFLLAAVESLAAAGSECQYLLNGHGGNHSHLVNAVKAAGERMPGVFCATSWLYLSGEDGTREVERLRRSGRGGMGHACELETSLMLHLDPRRVRMERAVDEIDFAATPNYYMDWIEGGALIANPPWEDDTRTGAYGAPTLADADHGAAWLAAAAKEKAAHTDEILEQRRMRRARRGSTG